MAQNWNPAGAEILKIGISTIRQLKQTLFLLDLDGMTLVQSKSYGRSDLFLVTYLK